MREDVRGLRELARQAREVAEIMPQADARESWEREAVSLSAMADVLEESGS